MFTKLKEFFFGKTEKIVEPVAPYKVEAPVAKSPVAVAKPAAPVKHATAKPATPKNPSAPKNPNAPKKSVVKAKPRTKKFVKPGI